MQAKAARPAQETLTVQASWINDSEFLGYFVAMANGYYAEAGITVRHLPGHAGLVPERTLLDGTADIALSSPESVAATRAATGARFKIIGAQFQKSPLGIVSRASDPIRSFADLSGKTLAVPAMNADMVRGLLKDHGLPDSSVELVGYDHGPAPLIAGEIHACVDFIVDAQFKLKLAGVEPHAILLFDHGAPLYNNVVVVLEDFAAANRSLLKNWLAASRRGWEENYRDPALYPRALRGHYLDETRTLDNELFANRTYQPLVACSAGILTMSAGDIRANVECLEHMGFADTQSLFEDL